MAYRDDFRTTERDAWWSLPRILIGGLVLLIVLYGAGFLATGGDLVIYRFWAPKQADAQREVFEHSQSYVEGKGQRHGRLVPERRLVPLTRSGSSASGSNTEAGLRPRSGIYAVYERSR